MARIFFISLAASLIAFWAVTTKAEVWPLTYHEPAIGKTLTPNHPTPAPSGPKNNYLYEWKYQPAPPAPYLATPQQFAHPRQGYFPREGKVEQAPGYEYDFGGTGTYPPSTPMEGASWPHSYAARSRSGLHAPQPFRHHSGFETHYGCLHW